MSFTFRIEGIEEEHGYELPCSGCGYSLSTAPSAKEDPRLFNCKVCGGYGGPPEDGMPAPQFELCVANLNGLTMLEWLKLEPECFGKADAGHIIAAIASGNPEELVVPNVEDGNVKTHGRSPALVQHYLKQLSKIARKANQYGRRVVWD